jgi:hypothetical protein
MVVVVVVDIMEVEVEDTPPPQWLVVVVDLDTLEVMDPLLLVAEPRQPPVAQLQAIQVT